MGRKPFLPRRRAPPAGLIEGQLQSVDQAQNLREGVLWSEVPRVTRARLASIRSRLVNQKPVAPCAAGGMLFPANALKFRAPSASGSASIMARQPRVIRTLPALQQAVSRLRRTHPMIALVPTMGALHQGHLSLLRLGQRRARGVIVSIFVNPAQFAPTEDLASYPRNLKGDLDLLAGAGADLVWVPSTETMYPPGFATRIVPEGPATRALEDKFRPHFFAGVATVVAKLLLQCRSDVAIFGEKDYQQLKVITALARDLDLPVKILGAPIVRESDGLAMSSRNAYLSPVERERAPTLYRVLTDCADKIAGGAALVHVLEQGRAAIERAGFVLDYLEARHADTLQPVGAAQDGPIRLLVAARLGRTRLIDNVAV
jgi:pantoate--beta-alanine ligase